MPVSAIALTSFIHDDIRGVKDHPLRELIDEHLAGELERAGLIRVQRMDRRVDRELVQGSSMGKVRAAGTAIPSLSSPAAPALDTKIMGTLHLPKRGKKQTRSGGT